MPVRSVADVAREPKVFPMARRILFAAAVLLATALPTAAQSISLTLDNGRVTLITQNATPAAILAEWARQGQIKVVDGERIPGTPLTLRLEQVPEREALDIVLRGAAGYIAAPRTQQAAAHLSRFDRVIVMATSPGASAARAAAPSTRPAAPAAMMPQQPEVVEDAPQDVEQAAGNQEEPAVAAAEQPASSTNFDYANPQRYFAARQAEQNAANAAAGQAQEGEAAQPAADPSSPFGATGATRSTPGMLPTPPQNTQGGTGAAPVNPYGLPPTQSPGSQAAPPVEPDRAKYINPYSPTPPRP